MAKFLNVSAEQLTIGNGSENILEVIVKSYLTSNDSAVISQYAFATIPLLIKASGAKLISVPAVQWGHNIAGMIDACESATRIIFVVNPNNPTGTYTKTNDFLHLLNSVPSHVIIVADEAYVEYMHPSADFPDTLKLLTQYPNLIISRTFSKIFGLAGLRTGYSISSPEIADILNRARLPFNVNSIAQAAAVAALSDHEHLERSNTVNHQGMKQLEEGFKKLDIHYIPSLGNFISIDVKKEGNEVYEALLKKRSHCSTPDCLWDANASSDYHWDKRAECAVVTNVGPKHSVVQWSSSYKKNRFFLIINSKKNRFFFLKSHKRFGIIQE